LDAQVLNFARAMVCGEGMSNYTVATGSLRIHSTHARVRFAKTVQETTNVEISTAEKQIFQKKK